MEIEEKEISSTLIYDGKIIKVYKKDYMLPNGNIALREIVEHNGGVCVLVIDQDYTYLVRQFRSPMNDVLLELPAGKLDVGEDPRKGAIRELEEEIGLKAKSLIDLGYAYCSPGFCTEKIYMFACCEFERVTQHLDKDEFLNVEKIKISELERLIQESKIIDLKTISCLYKYLHK